MTPTPACGATAMDGGCESSPIHAKKDIFSLAAKDGLTTKPSLGHKTGVHCVLVASPGPHEAIAGAVKFIIDILVATSYACSWYNQNGCWLRAQSPYKKDIYGHPPRRSMRICPHLHDWTGFTATIRYGCITCRHREMELQQKVQ